MPADSRARDTVTDGAPFRTRLQSSIGRATDRVVDRYAPERATGRGDRSLGLLGFADRMLAQYVLPAEQSVAAGAHRAGSFGAAEHSWLFPYPWYQDELDWVQAARFAGERPAAAPGPDRGSGRAPAQLPLSLIAPGLASRAQPATGRPASTAGQRPAGPIGSRPAQPMTRAGSAAPMRAWTPLVATAALQAAEVLAGAAAQSSQAAPRPGAGAGLALELVVPSELADPRTHASSVARLRASLAASPAATTRPAPAGSFVPAAPAQHVPSRPPATTDAPLRHSDAPSQATSDRTPDPVAAEAARRSVSSSFAGPAATGTELPPAVQPAQREPLTALELLARGRDIESIAPAAGPRLALPVGLGGLVSGVDSALQVSRPLAAGTGTRAAGVGPRSARPTIAARPAGASAAAPAVVSLSGGWRMPAPSAGNEPAALAHVTWADRWLARFAGASAPSLATMRPLQPSVATGGGAGRHAPGEVYVFLDPALPAPAAAQQPGARASAPAPAAAPSGGPGAQASRGVAAIRPPAGAPRIADDGRVPDEVFAAIARATVPRRGAGARPAQPAGTTAQPRAAAPSRPGDAAAQPDAAPAPAMPTARRAPGGPADEALRHAYRPVGPGLESALGASPLASVLTGTLGASPGSVFDTRFLSPAAIAAAAAAGVLVTDRWSPAAGGAMARPRLLGGLAGGAPSLGMIAPSWDAGSGPGSPAAAPAGRTAGAAPAPTMPQVEAGVVRAATGRDAAGAPPQPPAAEQPAAPAAAAPRGLPRQDAGGRVAADQGFAPGAAQAAATAGAAPSMARASGFSGRPGAVAAMAARWSTEQEQASADLAFDFVPPELIVAARAYGFGPAEAVRAARLATSGQAGLSAMAAALDLTFVRAAQGDVVRPAAVHRAAAAGAAMPVLATSATGAPVSGAPVGAAAARGSVASGAASADAAAMAAGPPSDSAGQAPGALPALPGRRRMPRGAFLWPQASLDSLRVGAEEAGQHNPLAIAALDLLAAHVVAETGARMMGTESAPAGDVLSPAGAPGPLAAGAAEPPAREAASRAGLPAALPVEFEPIYLALSRSPAGRSLSPTVRAARALVLARQASPGRADSARARAAAAWAVMPMVLSGENDGRDGSVPAPAGERSEAGPADLPFLHLSAGQAGESLRSLVAPAAAPEAPRRPAAAAPRAPSAAPELVRTGASSAGRVPQATGGGEETVPPWFEDAARRMFQQQGDTGGISLAEMTLVNAAPARHVAASTASASRAPAPAPAPGSSGGGDAADVDVEALAEELFGELQRLLDIALERSGDPWQT